jgi:hypothetical protein
MPHQPTTADVLTRPTLADPGRPPEVDHGPGQAPRRLEYHPDYIDALARLIGWAHADGIELAGWLGEGLCHAAHQAGGMTVLLARRPGSWEADLVARLGHDRDLDPPNPLG